MAPHGFNNRSGLGIPLTTLFRPGKFGRMFPTLAPLEADITALRDLGAAMEDTNPSAPNLDNTTIPAGFTYLGQFVDHDMTFDTTTLTEESVDPLAMRNFRTPRLDLDSLYGTGPDDQPYLYERGSGGKFRFGQTNISSDAQNSIIPSSPNDLPRDEQKHALIGDPRNDENLAVAQFHVLMMKFHNTVFDTLAGEPDAFEKTRELVSWHYQWMLLSDFVKRLVGQTVLDDVRQNGRWFYHFIDKPFIPIEFSAAAYRLGHSMIRDAYDWNRVFHGQPMLPSLANGTLQFLFTFSGNGNLGGGPQVPSNWTIDWRQFFNLDRAGSTLPSINFSRKLDTKLVPTLAALPFIPPPENNLAVRNLIRGRSLGLPSGQAVAAALQVAPLLPSEITSTATPQELAAIQAGEFDVKTPLWYYILKEAEVRGNGEQLGPVGARIVAEVFVGLIEGDPKSFLARAPEWRPTLGPSAPNDFSMVDLIEFTNDPLKNGPPMLMPIAPELDALQPT